MNDHQSKDTDKCSLPTESGKGLHQQYQVLNDKINLILEKIEQRRQKKTG
jgi:hypothetical protein